MTAAKTDEIYRASCETGITPCLHGCHHGECYYREAHLRGLSGQARPEPALPLVESIGLDRIAELRQKLEVLEAEKAKLCEGVFTMWDALSEARAFSMRGAAGEPWHGANTALRKSGAARVIATDAREARQHRRPGEPTIGRGVNLLDLAPEPVHPGDDQPIGGGR